eukprot:GHVQ01004624.1.p2 GENE.GHVQ01004624.1~~GHVQ01004624.1.p2  ORF type:complete len:135 (+),score=19.80 GHVQ01004624.1:173-577(+)
MPSPPSKGNLSSKKYHFTKLYDILGITPDASQKDITRAYRVRARQLHPDKNKEDTAHEHFTQLQKAYDILKDDTKRKLYDATGGEEEESEDFNKSYEWFREQFPAFDGADIDAFENEYKGSEMESNDLADFYKS